MKNVVKKTLTGVLMFGLLGGTALGVSSVSGNNVVYADSNTDWKEVLDPLKDDDRVKVMYDEPGYCDGCDCNGGHYDTVEEMTKKECLKLMEDPHVKVTSIEVIKSDTQENVTNDVEEPATENTTDETSDPATETTEDTSEIDLTQLDNPVITSVSWISGDGDSAIFEVKAVISKKLADAGWQPGEFYLNVGEDATPENWKGIMTPQPGVDLISETDENGNILLTWKGSFYGGDTGLTFTAADAVNVSMSVVDSSYSSEIVSPSVTVNQGETSEVLY